MRRFVAAEESESCNLCGQLWKNAAMVSEERLWRAHGSEQLTQHACPLQYQLAQRDRLAQRQTWRSA